MNIIFVEVSQGLSDSTQQWAQFAEVVDCPQEPTDSLLVLWNGHVDNSQDGNWVGLKAISDNDMAHQ